MKIGYSIFEKALEIFNIVAIAGVVGLMLMNWDNIPEQIPKHFNISGAVDAWGSKNTLIFMIFMLIAIYLLLTVIRFFPQYMNMPFKITEENREGQYKNVLLMLMAMKTEIILMYGCIILVMMSGDGGSSKIVFYMVAVIFLTIGFFMGRGYKNR